MGFYIELEKINETESIAQYRFFNLTSAIEITPDNTGIIEINKMTGEVLEIQHAPNDIHGYIFERAAGALIKTCWQKNIYLDKTCWAS